MRGMSEDRLEVLGGIEKNTLTISGLGNFLEEDSMALGDGYGRRHTCALLKSLSLARENNLTLMKGKDLQTLWGAK